MSSEMSVPCGHLLGKGWPLGSRLWCLAVSLSLSHWYPGSGVVLDCIDSWSLYPYLLYMCVHRSFWSVCVVSTDQSLWWVQGFKFSSGRKLKLWSHCIYVKTDLNFCCKLLLTWILCWTCVDSESFARWGQTSQRCFFYYFFFFDERIKITLLAGHHLPASKTPFKWRFAGVPLMTRESMLAWWLCHFRGSWPVLLIKLTLYFCDFSGLLVNTNSWFVYHLLVQKGIC